MVRVKARATDPASKAVEERPARPLRADARRNRERVLKAARVAFGTEGSEASLDEIARRAGVGAGTIYRHFATKEALFEAVVSDRIQELVEEARSLSEDPDPGRAFSSFVDRLAREGARKRDLVEAFSRTGVKVKIEAVSLQDLTDVLEELLRRAQRAGAVRRDISAADVMALLTGAAFAICQSPADRARTDRLLAVMDDGLRIDRRGGRR